jgi:hypothetical protein
MQICRSAGYADTGCTIEAITWTLTVDREHVATLTAHPTGLILSVDVPARHRGEGYARALYEHANAEIGLYHVPAWGRTEEGDGFAEAMGGDTMGDQQACDILGLDLATVTGVTDY